MRYVLHHIVYDVYLHLFPAHLFSIVSITGRDIIFFFLHAFWPRLSLLEWDNGILRPKGG